MLLCLRQICNQLWKIKLFCENYWNKRVEFLFLYFYPFLQLTVIQCDSSFSQLITKQNHFILSSKSIELFLTWPQFHLKLYLSSKQLQKFLCFWKRWRINWIFCEKWLRFLSIFDCITDVWCRTLRKSFSQRFFIDLFDKSLLENLNVKRMILLRNWRWPIFLLLA